jgi:hypothetical protein
MSALVTAAAVAAAMEAAGCGARMLTGLYNSLIIASSTT